MHTACLVNEDEFEPLQLGEVFEDNHSTFSFFSPKLIGPCYGMSSFRETLTFPDLHTENYNANRN